MTKITDARIKELVCQVFEFGGDKWFDYEDEFKALCRAIEAELQPAQEPVAEFGGMRLTPEGTNEFWGWVICDPHDITSGTKFYTAPPAQPVQEPVAWLKNIGHGDYVDMIEPKGGFYGKCIPLYTAPPDQTNKLDLIAATEANDKLNELCRDQTAEIERLRHDLMVRETVKDERIAELEAALRYADSRIGWNSPESANEWHDRVTKALGEE
jgi:hypothetical protein